MAENAIVTLEQYKKLALRGKAYSAELISELAGMMATGLEEAQHILVTVALPAANWNNRAQTVKHESLLADSGYVYFVCGDADCFMDCCDTGIKADNVTKNGEIIFHCEVTPDVDLTVNVIRVPVKTDDGKENEDSHE